MKRLFNLFVLLLLFALNAKATDYAVEVMGTTVTSDNANDVLGNGEVKYNASSSTLTLTNANLYSNTQTAVIKASIRLNIVLVGYNQITATRNGAYGIYNDNASDGTYSNVLNISSSDGTGILIISGKSTGIRTTRGGVTIKDCYVEANGNEYGIYCEKTTSYAAVYVNNSTLLVEGSNYGSIKGFAGINFQNNSEITYPIGAKVGTIDGHKAVVDKNDNLACSQVAIRNNPYKLWIAGVEVTDDNAEDILYDGKVSYVKSTNTLTLKNANISYGSDDSPAAIYASTKINIKLIGDNTITNSANGGYGIYNDYVPTSTVASVLDISNTNGNATLTVNGSSSGIRTYRSGISIKSCSVTAKGEDYGIYCEKPNLYAQFTADNAIVNAEGTNKGSLLGFMAINLKNDVEITSLHSVGQIDNYKAMKDEDGNVAKSKVTIGKPVNWGLYICNVLVDKNNASDILGNRKVSYDRATKTLTLDNATVSCEGMYPEAIFTTDVLNIKVIGNCKIQTTYGNGVSQIMETPVRNSINIYGGTLLIEAGAAAIRTTGGGVKISNGTVIANGGDYGVTCLRNTGSNILSVDNATLTAKGEKAGSLVGFNEDTSKETALLYPLGCSFTQVNGTPAVTMSNGGIVKDEVIIDNALWVADKKVTSQNAADVLGDGKVSYDYETRTLTLNKANIHPMTGNRAGVIEAKGYLQIKLIGENTIVPAYGQQNGVYSKDDMPSEERRRLQLYLYSNEFGSLTIEHKSGSGICAEKGIKIENCRLQVSASEYGLWSNGSTDAGFYCDGSYVEIEGKNNGSICGFIPNTMDFNYPASSAILSGLNNAIVEPKEALFDSEHNDTYEIRHVAEQRHSLPTTKKVVLCPIAPILIEDEEDPYAYICVGMHNAKDILGDGTMSYDFVTNTLELNNCDLEEGKSIYALGTGTELENVKMEYGLRNINLVGNNTINGTLDVRNMDFLINVDSDNTKLPFTIIGENYGSLNVKKIDLLNENFTIKDCVLNTEHIENEMMRNREDGTEYYYEFIIDNSEVTISGEPEKAPIRGFYYNQWRGGTVLLEPESAIFSTGELVDGYTSMNPIYGTVRWGLSNVTLDDVRKEADRVLNNVPNHSIENVTSLINRLLMQSKK